MSHRKAVICSAPGRCGVVGNPTDMYGGSVISCSTVERATVRVEEADEMIFDVSERMFVVRNPDDLEPQEDYFDIPKAIVDFLGLSDLKFKLTARSNLPFRAGLSGSTAMMVAMLGAILAFLGRLSHPFRVAEIARHIELNYMRVVCGYQDAYMCTFGGINYMDFREKEFYRTFREEPYATMESLIPYVDELPFVLAHTGVQRISGWVHRPLRERWLEGDQEVIRGYLRAGHLARIGKKALLDKDWELLGELMNENHEIQRDLGGSGPANEKLIEVALDCGALGAKLAGGGSGGTIIALHLEPEEMIEALKKAGARRILLPMPVEGMTVQETEDSEGGVTRES